MDKKYIEKLRANVGSLISVNTVISTTHDSNIARVFIDDAELGVVFEINTDNVNNNIHHPYANISESSRMLDEKEVLFYAGAVFQIDSVGKENDSTWYIKLSINNEIYEHLEKAADNFEKLLTNGLPANNLFMKEDDLTMIKRYYKMLT